MGLAHSPRIVTDGLVFCIDAKNTKSYPGSGTSCTNIANSSITGTLSNITYDSEGTFVLNGTSSSANFGNPTTLQLTSAITISSWVYPESLLPGGQIVNKNANSGYRCRVGSGSGANTAAFFDRGGTNIITSNSAIYSIEVNNWYNISFTGSSAGLKAYINGILTNSNAVAYNPGAGAQSADFEIGYVSQFSAGNREYFDGKIAAVSVYNRELSAAEIEQNFEALRGRFGL